MIVGRSSAAHVESQGFLFLAHIEPLSRQADFELGHHKCMSLPYRVSVVLNLQEEPNPLDFETLLRRH